jgi:hypothetical protein
MKRWNKGRGRIPGLAILGLQRFQNCCTPKPQLLSAIFPQENGTFHRSEKGA